jgi:CheY-like chemotaxis protein
MNDPAAKLLAGHAGLCAVLVDMLIDKGIVSRSELLDRFERAQSVGGDGSESRVAVRGPADIVAYLEPVDAGAPPLDRTALSGETVLVVEGDMGRAEALRAALERAGAEVLIARTAAEALPRIAQFDFSAAVVECRPETREQRTLIRWLREDGVGFLYRAETPPDGKAMVAGVPVLRKSAPLHEVVATLARIAASGAEADAGAAERHPLC